MKKYFGKKASILLLALSLVTATNLEDSIPTYEHPFKNKDIKSIYHEDKKHL